MASERIVSPGVFTRELDQSYLPQGISSIGAAIIGPTAKGPAFIPTLVQSYGDFVKIFGDADGNSYVPYTVKNYLKNAGRATIVRTVGVNGYVSDAVVINVNSSSLTSSTVAVLAPTPSNASISASAWTSTFVGSSSLDFTMSSGSITYSLSLNPGSSNYITNVFDANPQSVKPLYIYANYPSKHADLYDQTLTSSVSASYTASIDVALANDVIYLSSSLSYTEAATPWIQSQTLSGKKYNLFKLISFTVGRPDIKVVIQDITPAGSVAGTTYGSFSIYIYQIDNVNTVSTTTLVESFPNLTLDPTQVNYVARAIGDQYRVFGADADGNSKIYTYGDFPNQSKHVRVEVATDDIIPVIAVPLGFGNYYVPINGTYASRLPKLEYVTTQYDGTVWNYRTYLGIDFTVNDNTNVMQPVPIVSPVVAAGGAFSLENCKMPDPTTDAEIAFNLATAPAKSKKFGLMLQGGFDGINPTTDKNMGTSIIGTTNIMGFDFTNVSSNGYQSYKRAVDAVSNPDEFDINMVILPGVIAELAPNIISYAMTMCEDRGDAFFLFDIAQAVKSPTQTVSLAAGYDSNYSATYYPWVKIYDDVNAKYLWAPPSVVMAGVIAFNDRVAAEWYAPAGLNRGGIDSAVQVYTRLTQAERDTLYEGRINPIAAFSGQGIVAWGQKTLQVKASALDRINVRRLLIALKKYIASTTKYLVFEQNTNATRTRFLNIVNPYLESVQQRQGLYTFKVVMDETNNTPDIIDRNMMYGQIWLQPSRTAEMIIIDFNIMPTGASFTA